MHIGAKYILGSWVLIERCWFISITVIVPGFDPLLLKVALFRLAAHTILLSQQESLLVNCYSHLQLMSQ